MKQNRTPTHLPATPPPASQTTHSPNTDQQPDEHTITDQKESTVPIKTLKLALLTTLAMIATATPVLANTPDTYAPPAPSSESIQIGDKDFAVAK